MTQPIQNRKSLAGWIPWTILALSIVGFADAAYLSAKYFQGEAPTCVLFSGCEVVTTSQYSTLGPVPLAVLGTLFYFTVLVLAVIFIDKKSAWAIKYLALLSIPGFLFTLYLVSLQAFVLNAWCVYCVTSAISSTAIFLISQFARYNLREGSAVSLTN